MTRLLRELTGVVVGSHRDVLKSEPGGLTYEVLVPILESAVSDARARLANDGASDETLQSALDELVVTIGAVSSPD